MTAEDNLIAVFGGAFDPPHYGHLVVIGALLNFSLVRSVWLIPSGVRSDKYCQATPQQRLEMTRLFVNSTISQQLLDTRRVEVRDDEILSTTSLEGTAHIEGTVELFDLLSHKNPGSRFALVVGSDLLAQLPKWRHAERLQSEVKFLCVLRPDTQRTVPTGYNVTFVPNTIESPITSTLCREAIRSGSDVTALMPPEVSDYIYNHELYLIRSL